MLTFVFQTMIFAQGQTNYLRPNYWLITDQIAKQCNQSLPAGQEDERQISSFSLMKALLARVLVSYVLSQ